MFSVCFTVLGNDGSDGSGLAYIVVFFWLELSFPPNHLHQGCCLHICFPHVHRIPLPSVPQSNPSDGCVCVTLTKRLINHSQSSGEKSLFRFVIPLFLAKWFLMAIWPLPCSPRWLLKAGLPLVIAKLAAGGRGSQKTTWLSFIPKCHSHPSGQSHLTPLMGLARNNNRPCFPIRDIRPCGVSALFGFQITRSKLSR